jgi:hypothetical protein
MTKRIVLIFCLLAALILPAAAATKSSHRKHVSARSRKAPAKAKAVRKSTHRRTRTAASRKRAARARAARARRQRLAKK